MKLSENYFSREYHDETLHLRTIAGRLLGDCVRAQAQDQPSPAEAKAFAAQYVAATNAKDIPRLLTLYHPKSAACITPDTKDYYDWALGKSACATRFRRTTGSPSWP